MWLALVFFTLTSVTFFLMNALGFMLVPAAVILLRTAAYADKYRQEDLGLACFGLGYVGFGLALFGRGLIQTYAGCTSLRRGCYQPMLPSYWNAAFLLVGSKGWSEPRSYDAQWFDTDVCLFE